MNKINLLTTGQVAELLGVNRITVFNMIKRGELKAEKIGRNYVIDRADLGIDDGELSSNDKKDIKKAVKRVIKEYGETLKLLGKE